MSNKRSRNKKLEKSIAKKRICKLFSMAEQRALEGKLNLANRYVQIARKISMKYLVPIPKEYKRKFCKHCYAFLVPGLNSRFRINNSKLVIYCKNCNKLTRIPFKNSK